ncbi:MAG: TIGR03936 family radical SAM-associated protein [Nocardioidaceae bacterium]
MPDDPSDRVANTEAPNPQLPVAQRLRIRYAKRGRLRFTSHRDFSRAFERAVRRTGLPIAFSSGYSPHPRISYAGASPTGASSEAEYLEIALTRECDLSHVHAALDEALPDGLDVLTVVPAHAGALADLLEAGAWQIALPGVPEGDVRAAVDAFLAAESIEVSRMTKKGLRAFDCRAAVVRLVASTGRLRGEPCAILEVVVRHGVPSVRPDDVLAGLREIAGLESPIPPEQTRLAQGPLDLRTGTVGDPFASDRDASQEQFS